MLSNMAQQPGYQYVASDVVSPIFKTEQELHAWTSTNPDFWEEFSRASADRGSEMRAFGLPGHEWFTNPPKPERVPEKYKGVGEDPARYASLYNNTFSKMRPESASNTPANTADYYSNIAKANPWLNPQQSPGTPPQTKTLGNVAPGSGQKEYIKFKTPSGMVLGVIENGIARMAQGTEVTQIALGQVPARMIQSTTSDPLQEYNASVGGNTGDGGDMGGGGDMGAGGEDMEGQDDSGGMWDQYLEDNPFLAEQFEDEKYKQMFKSFPDEFKNMYIMLAGLQKDKIEAGQVINPDIQMTPAEVTKLLDQATTELEPHFQEQMNFVRKDLDTSLQRLQADYQKNVQRAEDPFKERLADQAESEAQSGTAFSSERAKREQRIVTDQQQRLDDSLEGTLRAGQDMAQGAERTLGSSNFGMSSPGVQQFQAGMGGFSSGGSRTIFTPQGNLMGDIPKQRQVAIRTRRGELESDFRSNRAINLNPY